MPSANCHRQHHHYWHSRRHHSRHKYICTSAPQQQRYFQSSSTTISPNTTPPHLEQTAAAAAPSSTYHRHHHRPHQQQQRAPAATLTRVLDNVWPSVRASVPANVPLSNLREKGSVALILHGYSIVTVGDQACSVRWRTLTTRERSRDNEGALRSAIKPPSSSTLPSPPRGK